MRPVSDMPRDVAGRARAASFTEACGREGFFESTEVVLETRAKPAARLSGRKPNRAEIL